MGEGNVRHVAQNGVPVNGRIEPAGDVADAADRNAVGGSSPEALCVAFGGVDSYDVHAIETVQCMVERRKGGETGVEWLQAYRGENFWKAHEQGVWSPALFKAALCRSETLQVADARASPVSIPRSSR